MKKLKLKLSLLLVLLVALTGCTNASTQASPVLLPSNSPVVSASPSVSPSPIPSPVPSALFTPNPTVRAAGAESTIIVDVTPAPTLSTKQEIPVETTVYITNTGKKYHRDGCRYLKKSKIAISLTDAKADGYTPCSVCNPPE